MRLNVDRSDQEYGIDNKGPADGQRGEHEPRACLLTRIGDAQEAGAHRTRTSRDALPRRDRRGLAVSAGEALACAPGAKFERVGGTATVRVDVRIVTATHRDLESMVAQGTFREDLYYRLAVVPITVPPLRERPGDTARLVRHFVGAFAMSLSSPDLRIEDDAVDLLAEQTWPGNVRQVQNFLERLIVMAEGTILRRVDVERELGRGRGASRPEVALPALAPSLSEPSLSLDEQRRGVEKDALLRALAQADNNRTRAARILGVSRRTLYNKLAEYGVS